MNDAAYFSDQIVALQNKSQMCDAQVYIILIMGTLQTERWCTDSDELSTTL